MVFFTKTKLLSSVFGLIGFSVVTEELHKKRASKPPTAAAVHTECDLLSSLCAASVSTLSATWPLRHVSAKDKLSSKANMPNKDVVLVTGGAGFLGQHIVKLLQEQYEDVAEIRVFDCKTYTNKLGHGESVPVQCIVGDLRSPSDVERACEGVDAVIHTAGVVSFGNFPDFQAMEDVNVKGTSNVISACVAQSVPRLVFTSTVDVVVGYDEIYNGDETLPIPDNFLFPGYPDTKHRAEQMVIAANGQKLAKGDGACLHTLALRPNVMYGEGDPYFIPSGLRGAKSNCGVLPRVGNGKALFQQAYVGNVAWGHVRALHSLKHSPDQCGGLTYFLTDHTPICNSFDFMDHFLRPRGYRVSNYSVPYPLVYSLMYLTETFLWALSPLYKVKIDAALCSIIYINKTFYFSRTRAEDKLSYQPLYSYTQSLENSMGYYMELEL